METITTDIKVGDSVYWRIRVDMFMRTLSGTVEEINDGIATVSVNTQSTYGKRYKKSVGAITKNKKQ